ncbi:iron complex transport system ATP-binding protein [Tamaricihabitans halophyticus]|uniref:Iron complex transport system ATP-binding protein n=1 Tax=Tamaricihabitans halophyticus TaxID=1262583 RepID=A0A4R2QN46_9PSEU|nr:ABC transporter ATP-binding protein [Tamaricihabitans halophyticus]TCP50018.1 iron complex transport system ATP-binding protein [Tamaricihabitans halophyticus]
MSGGQAGLSADRVSRTAGGRLILDTVSVTPAAGSTVGVLGPNGSGKSTLLRLLAGVLAPTSGLVTLDDQPLPEWGRRRLAKRVAVVQQQADTQVELSVRDVVSLGRIPHRGPWSPISAEDHAVVAAALVDTGLADKADRAWQTLSGGERQRAQIARALVQQPRELLLDEPTNHLDIQYQLDLLTLISRLPLTTIVALHDLNLAAMYCDQLVVLNRGSVVAVGTPRAVLTVELLAEVYGVRAEIEHPETDGPPHVRFLGVLGQ